MFDDDEPVFKRSKWGTNRYVYNAANPVGMALIVISVAVAGVLMIMISTKSGPFSIDEDPARPSPMNTDVSRFLDPYLPQVVPTASPSSP